jgi:hypothetical protein
MFLDALIETRVISGQTLQSLSDRAEPPIRAGAFSRLLNLTTLPKTWKTTGIFLTTCGMSPEQTDVWKAGWERLRTTEPAQPTADPPAATENSGPTRWWGTRPGARKHRPGAW